MEFNYSELNQAIENGTKKLRLLKEGEVLIGFYVLKLKVDVQVIEMIWVLDKYRNKGIGKKLIQDVMDNITNGLIVMDIWGGEPMMNLARSVGFKECTYDRMVNAFCFNK